MSPCLGAGTSVNCPPPRFCLSFYAPSFPLLSVLLAVGPPSRFVSFLFSRSFEVCTDWSSPSSRICQCQVSLCVLSERSYSSDRDASLTQQSMTLILQFLASWGHRHRQCISTCEPQRWCPSCTGSSRCTKYQRRTLAQAAFQRAILAREGTSQAVHLWEHPHRGS